MNIADKLKQTLSATDICSVEQTDKPYIERIIKPAVKRHTIPSITPGPQKVSIISDMNMKVINKIRKTPFWKEYSPKTQEAMIRKYYDSKINIKEYSGIKFSQSDKDSFVAKVLKAVNE